MHSSPRLEDTDRTSSEPTNQIDNCESVSVQKHNRGITGKEFLFEKKHVVDTAITLKKLLVCLNTIVLVLGLPVEGQAFRS